MMKKGEFIISLDFELHWGVFDKMIVEDNVKYFTKTKMVIPKILEIFASSNINATWATVGMLFLENYEKWKEIKPELYPCYLNKKLSAYVWGGENEKSLLNGVCHFAPILIDEIFKTKGQELASHTFSHYYCLEEGQGKADFELDLKLFDKQIKRLKSECYSLVFPRNQFNKEYLENCLSHDINVVRANPKDWFWDINKKETFIKKAVRTLDCYFPITNTVYDISEIETYANKLVLLPSSRFLKPISKFSVLNKLRNIRIKNEMTDAAKNNKCYHLWWHPHNFGENPEKSMESLKEIINHYTFLHEKYQMRSSSMIDIYNKYFNKR